MQEFTVWGKEKGFWGKKIKTRKRKKKIMTILTTDILKGLDFKDNGKCEFPFFENMSYWVKNGVCLFYNTPIKTDYQESFYIGYAEQRQGKYTAVAFRWIDSLEELVVIFEGITMSPVSSDVSLFFSKI